MKDNVELQKVLSKVKHESEDYNFNPNDPEPWKVMTPDEVNDPNRKWVKIP